MAYTKTIVDGGAGVIFTYSGFVTDEEFRSSVLKHYAQPAEDYSRYRYSISDFLAVTDMNVEMESVSLIARASEEAAEKNGESVVTLIADNDLYFGLSRMWASLAGAVPWEIGIYRTREETETWIRERVQTLFGIDDLKFR